MLSLGVGEAMSAPFKGHFQHGFHDVSSFMSQSQDLDVELSRNDCLP